MKTTIELPDDLLSQARLYGVQKGKTFKDVMIEALGLLLSAGDVQPKRPRLGISFCAFPDAEEIGRIQGAIDAEFNRVDSEEWK